MGFFRRVRGVRASMPSGYILGRKSAGRGAAEMLKPSDITQEAHQTSPQAAPGTGGLVIPPGGLEGQVLTLVAGIPVWQDLPIDDDTIVVGGSGGMLPLVNGDTPGPVAIADDVGQFIGVPL